MAHTVWNIDVNEDISFNLTKRTIDRYNLFKQHDRTYIIPLLTSIATPDQQFILYEIKYKHDDSIPIKSEEEYADDFYIEEKHVFNPNDEILADDLKTMFLHCVLNGGIGNYNDDVAGVMDDFTDDIDNLLGHKISNPRILDFGGALPVAGGGANGLNPLSLVNILSIVMRLYPEKSTIIRDTSIDILSKIKKHFETIISELRMSGQDISIMTETVTVLTRDIEDISKQPVTARLKYNKRSKKRKTRKKRRSRRTNKIKNKRTRRTRRTRRRSRKTRKRIKNLHNKIDTDSS